MANHHRHPFASTGSNFSSGMPIMTQHPYLAQEHHSNMPGAQMNSQSSHNYNPAPPMNDLNLGTTNNGYASQFNSGVQQPHPMYQIPPTMPLSIQAGYPLNQYDASFQSRLKGFAEPAKLDPTPQAPAGGAKLFNHGKEILDSPPNKSTKTNRLGKGSKARHRGHSDSCPTHGTAALSNSDLWRRRTIGGAEPEAAPSLAPSSTDPWMNRSRDSESLNQSGHRQLSDADRSRTLPAINSSVWLPYPNNTNDAANRASYTYLDSLAKKPGGQLDGFVDPKQMNNAPYQRSMSYVDKSTNNKNNPVASAVPQMLSGHPSVGELHLNNPPSSQNLLWSYQSPLSQTQHQSVPTHNTANKLPDQFNELKINDAAHGMVSVHAPVSGVPSQHNPKISSITNSVCSQPQVSYSNHTGGIGSAGSRTGPESLDDSQDLASDTPPASDPNHPFKVYKVIETTTTLEREVGIVRVPPRPGVQGRDSTSSNSSRGQKPATNPYSVVPNASLGTRNTSLPVSFPSYGVQSNLPQQNSTLSSLGGAITSSAYGSVLAPENQQQYRSKPTLLDMHLSQLPTAKPLDFDHISGRSTPPPRPPMPNDPEVQKYLSQDAALSRIAHGLSHSELDRPSYLASSLHSGPLSNSSFDSHLRKTPDSLESAKITPFSAIQQFRPLENRFGNDLTAQKKPDEIAPRLFTRLPPSDVTSSYVSKPKVDPFEGQPYQSYELQSLATNQPQTNIQSYGSSNLFSTPLQSPGKGLIEKSDLPSRSRRRSRHRSMPGSPHRSQSRDRRSTSDTEKQVLPYTPLHSASHMKSFDSDPWQWQGVDGTGSDSRTPLFPNSRLSHETSFIGEPVGDVGPPSHTTSQSLPGHYTPRRLSEKSVTAVRGPPQHVGPLHPHLMVDDKTPDSEEAETDAPLVSQRRDGEGDGHDPNEGNGGVGKNVPMPVAAPAPPNIVTAAVTVTNQPVTTAPVAQPIRWRSNLGQHSKQMKCPHCYKQIYTKVTYKSDDCTYFAAGLCCICCCCFIPFCLRELKAAHHFCPMCQVYIGSY